MARPTRSETERRRDGMRAAAVMHELALRVGAENPHQFAGYFDRLTMMTTQATGKWRLNFSGDKALSAQQLYLLARVDADVVHLHQNGPDDLWRAMWGDVHMLWQLCRTRLISAGQVLDDRIWEKIENGCGSERDFLLTMAEFEGECLLAEFYGVTPVFRHLTESISLYRLHREMSAIIPLGMDGAGVARCVRLCLEEKTIAEKLQRLGVLDGVWEELAAVVGMQGERMLAEDRWDILASKLDWIG